MKRKKTGRTMDTMVLLQLITIGGILKIMSTVDDLKQSLDNIQSGVGSVAEKLAAQTQAIKDLKDQLAQGTPVSQEQLDALEAEAQAIEDALAPLVVSETV